MRPLKSAHLKIDRAEKHINELSDLFQRERPFRYMLETDTQTLERAVYAKADEAVIDQISLIGGDTLYQLRSALDHAFFSVVRPHFPQGEGAVQFPFSRDKAGLEGAIKNRCAHKVSPEFYAFMLALNAHGEPGGYELLYLLYEANNVDKHRSFLPTTENKRISSDVLRRYAPDFPNIRLDINIGGAASGYRDIAWNAPSTILKTLWTPPGTPLTGKHEFEIPIPISVFFRVGKRHDTHEVLPTLKNLASAVRSVVNAMERFA